MEDEQLVRQSLSGDQWSYGELVRRWSARVLAVCHSRVGDLEVAEELAQETLVRGFRFLPKLREADKFGPWLAGIAHRTCLDWLKNRRRREVTLSALDPNSQPLLCDDETSPDAGLLAREQNQELVAAIGQLPAAYREVIMLYYYDDVTYADVAAILNVSTATVNARLTKARGLLRKKLLAAIR